MADSTVNIIDKLGELATTKKQVDCDSVIDEPKQQPALQCQPGQELADLLEHCLKPSQKDELNNR